MKKAARLGGFFAFYFGQETVPDSVPIFTWLT